MAILTSGPTSTRRRRVEGFWPKLRFWWGVYVTGTRHDECGGYWRYHDQTTWGHHERCDTCGTIIYETDY